MEGKSRSGYSKTDREQFMEKVFRAKRREEDFSYAPMMTRQDFRVVYELLNDDEAFTFAENVELANARESSKKAKAKGLLGGFFESRVYKINFIENYRSIFQGVSILWGRVSKYLLRRKGRVQERKKQYWKQILLGGIIAESWIQQSLEAKGKPEVSQTERVKEGKQEEEPVTKFLKYCEGKGGKGRVRKCVKLFKRIFEECFLSGKGERRSSSLNKKAGEAVIVNKILLNRVFSLSKKEVEYSYETLKAHEDFLWASLIYYPSFLNMDSDSLETDLHQISELNLKASLKNDEVDGTGEYSSRRLYKKFSFFGNRTGLRGYQAISFWKCFLRFFKKEKGDNISETLKYWGKRDGLAWTDYDWVTSPKEVSVEIGYEEAESSLYLRYKFYSIFYSKDLLDMSAPGVVDTFYQGIFEQKVWDEHQQIDEFYGDYDAEIGANYSITIEVITYWMEGAARDFLTYRQLFGYLLVLGVINSLFSDYIWQSFIYSSRIGGGATFNSAWWWIFYFFIGFSVLYLVVLEVLEYYLDIYPLREFIDDETEEVGEIRQMTEAELQEEMALNEFDDEVDDEFDGYELILSLPFFFETAFLGQFKLEPTMDEEFVVQDGVRYFEFETYNYFSKRPRLWSQISREVEKQQTYKTEVAVENRNVAVLKKKLEDQYYLMWSLTNGWDEARVMYSMYILILAEVKDLKVALMFLEKRKKDLLLLDFIIFRRSILKQLGNELGLFGNFYQKMEKAEKRVNYFEPVLEKSISAQKVWKGR